MCEWTRQSRGSDQHDAILNSNVMRDAGSLDVSVVACKPITCNLAEAPMRDNCDFKWGSVSVSSEFGCSRMAKASMQ